MLYTRQLPSVSGMDGGGGGGGGGGHEEDILFEDVPIVASFVTFAFTCLQVELP